MDTTPSDTGLATFVIHSDQNKYPPPASPFESNLEESHHMFFNRNNSSELNAIKQIRQTLGRTVHPAAAWTSLSRGSSKTASFSNSRSNSRPSSQYECDIETDELMVSYPNPRRDPDDDTDHTRLPSISQPLQYSKHRNSSGSLRRTRRRRSLADDYEVQSDLLPEAFYSEVLRVLSNIKMLESEARNSSVIACQFKSALFHITVNRGGRGKFHMHFEWLSGGNEKYYSEIRDHIMNMLVI